VSDSIKKKIVHRPFRLIAIIAILGFMFIEEIILKPLRKIKIVILENTIKRMNGYATIGLLAILKTIEGLCKIALPFAANGWIAFGIVALDGVLGFISMNIIIHGHENLEQFSWYVRFVAWLKKLREEVKAMPIYKQSHAKVIEIKAVIKVWWGELMLKIFGKRNPRGLIRYIKTALRLRRRKKARII